MVPSRRERMLVLVAVAVVAILGLDRFVVTWLLDSRVALNASIATASVKLKERSGLLAGDTRVRRKWESVVAPGLKTDASAAESQVLHAVRDWAQDAGLALASLKPERTEQDKHFQQIVFRAAGTGSMAATARFLWRIQTASIPVRITDLQLSSRREGVDDLSLQIGISTLYPAEEPSPKPARSEPSGPAKEHL